jgi:hypothetical protein
MQSVEPDMLIPSRVEQGECSLELRKREVQRKILDIFAGGFEGFQNDLDLPQIASKHQS